MEALVSSYLRNKLVDAGAKLMWTLKQLNVLREVEYWEVAGPTSGR